MPEITVGIPFYNAADTILHAIRSVFAQTLTDWQLFLVDDGSTDGSVALARTVTDPRVEVLSDGQHLGLPARLNQITELASAPYIARMDADDLMHPDRLETQWRFLEQHPRLDVVSTGMYSIDAGGRVIGRRGQNRSEFSCDDLLRRRAGIAHATIMVRTSWARRNSYDETVLRVEDLDLWVRASKGNDLRAESLELPLYFYREFKSLRLRPLLRTQAEEARLIRRHSTYPLRLELEARVGAKMTATLLLAGVGQLDALLRRRNRQELTRVDLADSVQALGLIDSVALPTTPPHAPPGR